MSCPHGFENLPTLGLGASLSLSADPDPVSLVRAAGGPQFVEYAGLVDAAAVLDEVQAVHAAGAPTLFHPSFINFCGTHANSGHWLQAAAAQINAVESAWFAQDCAYCFWQDDYHYSTGLGYFIPPILNRASLETAVTRVREVQRHMPVPVAIEPPPMAFTVGTMPLFEFFGKLANRTDCAILLDMGHLVSYQMASGKKVSDEMQFLPEERVIEVHIAGGRLRRAGNTTIYVDAHEDRILPQTWGMLEEMLPQLPNVKALCYECEGVQEGEVLDVLQRLRALIQARSASPALVAKVHA